MTTSWSHSTPPTNWTWVEDQLEDVETAAGRCARARSHGSYDLCSVISRRSLPAPVCLIDKIRRSLITRGGHALIKITKDLPVGLTDPLAARLRGPSQTQQCCGFPGSTLGNRTANAKKARVTTCGARGN
jgi:hypothetical protein